MHHNLLSIRSLYHVRRVIHLQNLQLLPIYRHHLSPIGTLYLCVLHCESLCKRKGFIYLLISIFFVIESLGKLFLCVLLTWITFLKFFWRLIHFGRSVLLIWIPINSVLKIGLCRYLSIDLELEQESSKTQINFNYIFMTKNTNEWYCFPKFIYVSLGLIGLKISVKVARYCSRFWSCCISPSLSDTNIRSLSNKTKFVTYLSS